MEFLVRIKIDLPADMAPERRLVLSDAERAKGRALVRNGSIIRIWRVGDASTVELGHLENVGLWAAPNEAALHGLLNELPFFPWMTVAVTPLRPHPLESGGAGGGDEESPEIGQVLM